MSERYGRCEHCYGRGSVEHLEAIGNRHMAKFVECYLCGGTGMSGSVDSFLKKEAARDPIKSIGPLRKKASDI